MQEKEKLAQLVDKLKLGNEESFSEIYNLTNKYIFYVIMKIIKNEEQTYDLMQETYIQIYNKISTLEDSKAFLSWAGRIATNKTYRYMQKYRKEVLVDEEGEYIFDNTFEEREEFIPHEVLESEEKKRLIREIIESLSEVQKLTVYKYYFYMQSILQIAEDMECSEGTVKSRLNYARKKIEEGVLDLEKKGTKLYGFGALPVLFMLLREEAKSQSLSHKGITNAFKGISEAVNIKSENNINSDSEIDNFDNENLCSEENNKGSLDENNDLLEESNINKYSDTTNKAIGKSLLAGKMIKGGIALLTAATIAGGAMAISYLNNNESENIDTSIQTGISESVNDEDNKNEEVSYSEEESIDKTILIENTLEQAKILHEFSITGNYIGFDNYKEVINSIGVDEEGPYGWAEINWVDSMIHDLSGTMESLSNKIKELNEIGDFTEEEKQGIDEIKQMINIFINNQDFINDISNNFELVANYSTDDEFFKINVETAKEFLDETLSRYKQQIDILKNLIL
ncbi:RNA polymerase sigma factor [Clostridioides difficile]